MIMFVEKLRIGVWSTGKEGKNRENRFGMVLPVWGNGGYLQKESMKSWTK